MLINISGKKNGGIFLSIFLFLMTSCGMLIGYKSIGSIDTQAINKFYSKIDVKKYESFVIDTMYLENVTRFYIDSTDIKNMLQPIRAHYFVNKTLVSSLINCYAPGVLKLDWNTDNRFSTFPPVSHYNFKKNVSIDDIEDLTGYKIRNKKDLLVVVFWSRVFERKSADFINLIYNNLMNQKTEFTLLLVNEDALYL